MKKIYVRFLIVCWVLVICGGGFTFLYSVFTGTSSEVASVFGSVLGLFCMLFAVTFITLGVINPKKLLNLI